MVRRFMLLLASTLAVLVLVCSAASADWLRLSPEGRFSMASSGSLTFTEGGEEPRFHIECPVSLSGSFSSGSFATTSGTTFGNLTSSTVGRCSESTVTFLGPRAERAWALRYSSTVGEFPDMLSGMQLRIGSAAFEVNVGGARCLYEGELEARYEFAEIEPPGGSSEEAEPVNPFTIARMTLGGNRVRRVGENPLCPANAVVRGSLRFAATQRVAAGPRLVWRESGTSSVLNFGMQIGAGPFENVFRVENPLASVTVREVRVIGGGGEFTFDNTRIMAGSVINTGQTREITIRWAPTEVNHYIGHLLLRMTNGRAYMERIRGQRTA